MPSIFHRLQRRSSRPSTSSKANGKHDNAYQGEQNGNGVAHRISSSTLNSSPVGSSTPSTTPATSTTEENLEQPKTHGPTPLPVRSPTRAQRPSVEPIKRYSMNVSASVPHLYMLADTTAQGLSSTTSNGSHSSINKSSLLAPRVISISDGSWVGCVARRLDHY
jgi:hypothetical protein